MTSCLSWSEAAGLSGGILKGSDGPITGLFQADSRNVNPGDVFVALPGSSRDGHDFLASAFSKGASGAMVKSDKINSPWPGRLIVTEDVESSLIALAKKRLSLVQKAIAVTGSVGKTTVREMISQGLGGLENGVYRARNSHNTLIGCALTMAEMPSSTKTLILEMGTNHPGEIGQMVREFPVRYALITKIAKAHLEGLGSLEGVLKAKAEILGSKSLKTLFLNCDDEILKENLMEAGRSGPWSVVSIGSGPDRDFQIIRSSFEWKDEPVLTVELSKKGSKGKTWTIKNHLLGEHNGLLLSLAFGVCVSLGADPSETAERLSLFTPCKGRGVLRHIKGVAVIDESYNANPSSMEMALKSAAKSPYPREKRFLVLGSMEELGPGSAKLHKDLYEKASLVGKTILFGNKWPENLKPYKDINALGDYLKNILSQGDLLLIKGSRANGLEGLLEILS